MARGKKRKPDSHSHSLAMPFTLGAPRPERPSAAAPEALGTSATDETSVSGVRAVQVLPDSLIRSLRQDSLAARPRGRPVRPASPSSTPPVVPVAGSGVLAGKKVCISGKVPGYVRDEALQALTEAGAICVDDAKHMNSSFDALIVSGQTAVKLAQGKDTSKTIAAKNLGVRIIPVQSNQEFQEILDGNVL
jgi:NAD-dependent DNA ligase